MTEQASTDTQLTTIVEVTSLIGFNETEAKPLVTNLIALLYRTVAPEQWIIQGGESVIRVFYNPAKKQSFFAILSTKKVIDQIQGTLKSLGL